MGLARTAGSLVLIGVVACAAAPVRAGGDIAPGSGGAAPFEENTYWQGQGGVDRRYVQVSVGRSTVVDLPRAARNAYVAEPKVAQAVVQTDRQLFITGMGDGVTTILVSDAAGRQVAVYEVRVARDTGSLNSALRSAIPGRSIQVRFTGDTVILSGAVQSPAEATRALDIARGFVDSPDKVVDALTLQERDQVMLKVTVAEVQRNVLKQLGINAAGSWNIGDVAVKALMDNPFGIAGKALTSSYASASSSDGALVIQAMEQVGVARTLAEPTLTAISGETANFLVGGEVPIPTGITCQSNNVCQPSIEFKKFGVSLNFTPVVLSSGRISLKIATEVSNIDNNNQLTFPVNDTSNFTIPGFKIRKQETTVELPSGGSLITAGLIEEGSRQAITGIPGAMDVPVLGALFRSRDYQRQETELVITVTPMIAKPIEARQVTRPDRGFADAPDPRAIFFGQVNRVLGGRSPGVPASSASAAGEAPAPSASVKGYFGHVGFILD